MSSGCSKVEEAELDRLSCEKNEDKKERSPQEDSVSGTGLIFDVDEQPPFHIAFMYAVQQAFSCVSGSIPAVYLIHNNICAAGNDVLFSELFSTTIFVNGLCTWLQCTFGTRLPILQGSNFASLVPVMALMSTNEWQCSEQRLDAMTDNQTVNMTDTSLTSGVVEEAWRIRIRAISGALALACAIETIIGFSGAIGYLTRFIGPLTVAPTIMMISLCLFPAAENASQHNWGIAVLTVALICFFSIACHRILVPVPVLGPDRKVHIQRYPMCQLFALVLATAISWLVCYILTVTDVFPDDPNSSSYKTRTDVKLDAIYNSRWLFIPYPGQWGLPTFNAGAFFGLLAITFCSVIESVGDYYATAAVCRLPPPPRSVVSRGIATEGFGSFIGALMGCCHATTSYSQTIGFVGMTRVASLYTWQLMGLMLMACALLGKFGAVLTLMPEPIVGGILLTGLGMVFSIGVSSALHIDMRAPRNMFTLGVALMFGLTVPYWINQHPDVIQTERDEGMNP
ncbi:Solute carrier family 23 member 2 [Lamellibrachia satsuma]|nr:Solute carrier family 23 member 2 [Lamellibrachia satsuma]